MGRISLLMISVILALCISTGLGWAARVSQSIASPEFVRIPGGAFKMGSDRFHREEQPTQVVSVGRFEITRTEVTNDQFARFVIATGYVTTAERALSVEDYPDLPEDLRAAGSMVFAQPAQAVSLENANAWWRYVPGADWRHPEGPRSSIEAMSNHPVVQVSPEDAGAYADWIGGRLPTEAEWEFAARGGLEGADYSWGEAYDPVQGWKANTWQGHFPNSDVADDGHNGTAPVGSYAANGYGLYDVAGNVWEHVSDWWAPGHLPANSPDPSGPKKDFAAQFASPVTGPMRVVKGGSWLCAPNFCLRYRPAARQAAELSLGTNHIGFRVVRDIQ